MQPCRVSPASARALGGLRWGDARFCLRLIKHWRPGFRAPAVLTCPEWSSLSGAGRGRRSLCCFSGPRLPASRVLADKAAL